jgi:hypothetical protein
LLKKGESRRVTACYLVYPLKIFVVQNERFAHAEPDPGIALHATRSQTCAEHVSSDPEQPRGGRFQIWPIGGRTHKRCGECLGAQVCRHLRIAYPARQIR